jgi:hypothetical protein
MRDSRYCLCVRLTPYDCIPFDRREKIQARQCLTQSNGALAVFQEESLKARRRHGRKNANPFRELAAFSRVGFTGPTLDTILCDRDQSRVSPDFGRNRKG